MTLTEKDVDYFPSSFSVVKINNRKYSEEKCNKIIYEIEHSGIQSIEWANIEEYGHLIVSFLNHYSFGISMQTVKEIIKIINKVIN